MFFNLLGDQDGEENDGEEEIDKLFDKDSKDEGDFSKDEQESVDEEQEDDDGSEDVYFPKNVIDLFIFDSMNPSIRKYRKSFIECAVASEDFGIELKDYNPKMFYPTHVMCDKFWDNCKLGVFTYSSHLLKVTEKPYWIEGLLDRKNISVACIIDYLFQQWEYYTGYCFDKFEDLIDESDEFQRFLYAIELFMEEGMDRVYEVFVGNPEFISLTHEYDGDFFNDEVCEEINKELFSVVICGEIDIEVIEVEKATKLQDYVTLKHLVTSSPNGIDEKQSKFFLFQTYL